ncbi:MAG: trypsin-like peptidase domain-containing protein [Microcoleaceae cyanobacterium]
MGSALELAVVRVFKSTQESGGGIAGSGFLVSPQYILTCAHVVAYALEISTQQEEAPTQIIELDFPVLELGQKLKAKVKFWAKRKTIEIVQDIAVLELLEPALLPEQAKPIKLIPLGNQDFEHHEFKALGFPRKGGNGEWARGELVGRVGKGRIQVEGMTETGLRLEEGFSGTAIWDENLQGVVGMAVTADQERPTAKVAFMTPTDVLLQVGDLAQVCQVDGRVQQAIALLQSYFEFFSKEIRYAYHQALPENSIPLESGKSLRDFPDSLIEMIQNLENYSLLERFLGFLLLHLQDLNCLPDLRSEIEAWLKRYLQDYQISLTTLRKEKALKQQQQLDAGEPEPCILLGVFEKSDSFVVRAWLIKNTRTYTPEIPEGCHSLIPDENVVINDKGNLIKQKIVSKESDAEDSPQPENLAQLPGPFHSN